MKPPIEFRPRRPLFRPGDLMLDEAIVGPIKITKVVTVCAAGKFDRTAYQREYMRKRRAAKREADAARAP